MQNHRLVVFRCEAFQCSPTEAIGGKGCFGGVLGRVFLLVFFFEFWVCFLGVVFWEESVTFDPRFGSVEPTLSGL